MTSERWITFDYQEAMMTFDAELRSAHHEWRCARFGDKRSVRDIFLHLIGLRFGVDPENVVFHEDGQKITVKMRGESR